MMLKHNKHNKVNFEIIYEGHQNYSKTYLMNIWGFLS